MFILILKIPQSMVPPPHDYANLMNIFLSSGNHQLEVAQLNIKLREVVSELEEVRFVCSQHHIIPGSSSTEGDEQEQHIYEEPPLEVGVVCFTLHVHFLVLC